LFIERSHEWLVETLDTAFDSTSRRHGLLGRNHLPHEHGLVIAPCQAVHTFGMRFPIDIVAVSREGRVLKVRSSVPARKISMTWNAFAIIELAAGVCASLGLVAGDRLLVVPRAELRRHEREALTA
jgi:uncharacterized membrane protein (UPF0127 family)